MDDVKENVLKVLSGEVNDWGSKDIHLPANDLVQMIKAIDGVSEGDLDTNGWDWDWFKYFTYKGRKYTLSGSGYYGGVGFSLNTN